MTDSERRRLRRSAVHHGIAVVIFAMLALSGATTAGPGLYGVAVPFMVTGLAGAGGAAVIAVSVWRLQRGAAGTGAQDSSGVRGEPGPGPVDLAPDRDHRVAEPVPSGAAATQRTARLAMVAAALVAFIAGVLLAPQGMDRGFAISVAAGLAVMLALFALFAGDRPRTVEQRA